ncbi:hypothetical protein NDU88_004594, partial [Pleurodeles waltl]
IWGGDFNSTPSVVLDRTSAYPSSLTNRKPIGPLQEWANVMGLHDIWRLGHPEQKEYSFYSVPHNTYTRIDIIWGTREIGALVTESEYLAKTLSDHAPLRVTLNWGRTRQAVPTWRFQ